MTWNERTEKKNEQITSKTFNDKDKKTKRIVRKTHWRDKCENSAQCNGSTEQQQERLD